MDARTQPDTILGKYVEILMEPRGHRYGTVVAVLKSGDKVRVRFANGAPDQWFNTEDVARIN